MRLRLRYSRRSGLGLLDVLIGTTVLGIALFAALALAGNNARLMSHNQNVAAASLLAQNKLEELRNENYADIVTGADGASINAQGDAGGIFTRAWEVTNDQPMVGMKTISVTVTWEQTDGAHDYTLNGVVAQ